MRCYLLEKVAFKLPGKGNRMVWGVLISRSTDGLCLIYVKKPDANWADSLVAAVPHPKGHYEAAERFVFSLGRSDLEDIGRKLQALGDDDSETDVRRLFNPEDLF